MVEKDYRIRVDLTFPPEVKQYADQLRDILVKLYTNAVVINKGSVNEEGGFIDIERCGHRLGLPCDKLLRFEVGKGKVYP